jgi:hypothetical protein
MRTLAAVALVALGGCYYDRPNPWRTSGDVAELQDKTEQDWALIPQPPFHPPQSEAPFFYDADLEPFRDTVLANADTRTLQDMRAQSAGRLAVLQARQADLLRQQELIRREQLREVNEQIRIESIRGKMIQARLDQGGSGR